MTIRKQQSGPTIYDIRTWPAAVNVEEAARALGISRTYAYTCIRNGTFPARTFKIGDRVKVLTASILDVLDPQQTQEPTDA